MFKKRKDFLVFGKPHIGKEEIDEVVKTLKSGWLGTGPKVELFEKKFTEYIGCKYSMAVNSATAGLHLALKTLGIGKGDEVITTPMTFCSTVNVIAHCQATPIFTDIDKDTWNIDTEEVEKKITKKTKAIIPVHLHGRPCEMDKIIQIAKKHKLYIIEDAAHALEAEYKKRKIGNIGDITVFSFYVTKNLTTAEGGMVTTNNNKWAEMIKIMSLHGLSRDAYKRYNTKVFRHYEAIVPGFKYNMTDIQASLGVHQLKRIENNCKIRTRYWEMYNEAFAKLPELITPAKENKSIFHAKHLYAILIKPETMKINRDRFINELIKRNVGTGIHFLPVHLHPYYRKTFNYKVEDFPNAEFVGSRTISLPLSPVMTEKDVRYIISSVKDITYTFKTSKSL